MAIDPEIITKEVLIDRAQALAPLFRARAREAEIARRPLDPVIDAVRESGLYAMMVPKSLKGHELDLDTFFEVALILSKADASMGWLTAFYIEHNYWFLHYPPTVTERVFNGGNYALAPGSLNIAAGTSKKVDGGYRVSGQWQWGTGIVHASWVMAGAMLQLDGGEMIPYFFLLPRNEVEPIDNWHIAGMSGTGSWDFKIENVFVPEECGLPFIDLLNVQTGIDQRFDGPLYRTPLLPILGLTAALPQLGAAQMALEEFCAQTKNKIASNHLRGGLMPADTKSVAIAEAALKIETAELLLRDVLGSVMAKRNAASFEERSNWLSRIAHAVFTCRDAAHQIGACAGASGNFLDNPIQRAVRDINAASGHIVFDRDARYGDFGRLLFGQKPTSMMV